MKKLISFLWLIILASCGEKGNSENAESGNILENLTYSVDTVMVDSKEKLFELNRGPLSSSVSEDGKYLFLFNSRFSHIQQINLDKLEWEKDFDFEVEGQMELVILFFIPKHLAKANSSSPLIEICGFWMKRVLS